MSLTYELISSAHAIGTSLSDGGAVEYLAKGGRRGGRSFFFGPIGFLLVALVIGAVWGFIKRSMGGSGSSTTQGYPVNQGDPGPQGYPNGTQYPGSSMPQQIPPGQAGPSGQPWQ